MPLRKTIMRVLSDYAAESKTPLKENLLAQLIRGQGADSVEDSLVSTQLGLRGQGSPGQGNWAEVPWIAVFYPVVTSSSTQGHYVVYLFNTTNQTVCLSLNNNFFTSVSHSSRLNQNDQHHVDAVQSFIVMLTYFLKLRIRRVGVSHRLGCD